MTTLRRFLLVFFSFLVVACSEDDYTPGPPSPGEEEEETPQENKMAEKIDGRISLVYVTYYGKTIPNTPYITHINYAFAELYMKNGVYQKFDLQGNRSRFDQVKKIKEKYPDIKISLSFTNSVSNSDNSRGGGFSALAKSPEMRKQFAQDCRRFVRSEGIDGIDIDWEFPGMTFGNTEYDDQVDVDNFTLLMKDLREELGDNILLTYAGYCMNVKDTDNGGRKYIDVKAVDPYVDFVNVMTYDLDAAPQPQSAIKKPSAYYDCTRAFEQYKSAGIAANKMVLGIPFYGRIDWNNVIDYRKIIELKASDGYIIDNWDEEGSVPYITKNGKYYAGYDNARSIGIKGKWIREKGMLGMMAWDFDGDDNLGTLRNAMWNAVMQK